MAETYSWIQSGISTREVRLQTSVYILLLNTLNKYILEDQIGKSHGLVKCIIIIIIFIIIIIIIITITITIVITIIILLL